MESNTPVPTTQSSTTTTLISPQKNKYDTRTRQYIADCYLNIAEEHQGKNNKRCSSTMLQLKRQFPQLSLNDNTVKTWVKRRKLARANTLNHESLTEKQKTLIRNHRTSRSKMTDREAYILKKFLKKCINCQNFPMKTELVDIVNDSIIANKERSISWQYLRRWLHRNDFSYKAIHKKSPGQILTINRIKELNHFWRCCQMVYTDRRSRINTAKIWCMDEAGFLDKDNCRRGWGLKGGDNQGQVVSETGSDTLVACVNSAGQTFSYFIRHTSGKIEYDVDGEQITQHGVKGMNTTIMLDWVNHFLSIASPGDILVMDNLNSHHSASVLQKLRDADIAVIFTPARLAYLVSPLDNFVFGFMKNQWRAWVSEKRGVFSKDEKQEYLAALLGRVTNSELLLSSFMRCGMPMFHPGEVKLDVELPLEKHVVRGRFTAFDTLWYRSSDLAQTIRSQRLPCNMYAFLHFVDVVVVTTCDQTGIAIHASGTSVSPAVTSDPSPEESQVLESTRDDSDSESITHQLTHGCGTIISPRMVYNIDLVDFIEAKKKETSDINIFVSNQHNNVKLFQSHLSKKKAFIQVIHARHHYCGVYVCLGENQQAIFYDSLYPLCGDLLYGLEKIARKAGLGVRYITRLQQVDCYSCGWYQVTFIQHVLECLRSHTDAYSSMIVETEDGWGEKMRLAKSMFVETLKQSNDASVMSELCQLSSKASAEIIENMISMEDELVDDDSASDDEESVIHNVIMPESVQSDMKIVVPQSVDISLDEESVFIQQNEGIIEESINTGTSKKMEKRAETDFTSPVHFSNQIRVSSSVKIASFTLRFSEQEAKKEIEDIFISYTEAQRRRRESSTIATERIRAMKKRHVQVISPGNSNVSLDVENLRCDKKNKFQGELTYRKAKREKQISSDLPGIESFQSVDDFEKAIEQLNYVSLQKACKKHQLPANKKASELRQLLVKKYRSTNESEVEDEIVLDLHNVPVDDQDAIPQSIGSFVGTSILSSMDCDTSQLKQRIDGEDAE